MPKDLLEGKVSESSVARVGDEHVARLAHHRLEAGDVVYGRRGDIGRRALIREREAGWLCGTGCLRISVGNAELDSGFLFYYLGVPSVVSWIQGQAVGTTMANLNTAILRSIEVRYPPIDVQRRIAAVLSTYDDLIENNTRRIAILEEMARALYREWFVEFRFQGHEATGMMKMKTKEGVIPLGWGVGVLADHARFIGRGIAPTYDEAGPSVVINQKCVRDGRLDLGPARQQRKAVPPEKLVHTGDVLVNSTGVGTLGRVAQVLGELPTACTVDSHVSIIRPAESVAPDFFGLALLALEPFFEAQGVGATGQTELSRERIGKAPFILPPRGLQDGFARLVHPLRMETVVLRRKNDVLRRTRDFLLPKLVSGQIDVSSTATLPAD